MNQNKLGKIFLKAKSEQKDVALELTVPGRKATEVIIVKYSNLNYKLGYYQNNYTEDLVLKKCADIKIINAKVIDFKM